MADVFPDEWHSAVSLGVLLLASLAGGILADWGRLPKVTAYLLAGMLVGPSCFHAINTEHLHHLLPLTKLAMALVLLELGCRFPLAALRPILRRSLWLSGGEILATFAAVTIAIGLTLGAWAEAVLLGALALATAPATTVLVFKEANSEGPLTELTSVLVAFNNIAAIIGFELLFVAARLIRGDYTTPVIEQVLRLVTDLGGACLLGIAGGLTISFCSGLLSRRRWLVMVLAVSILMLGLCESWHLPYMLSFLLAGLVLVNTSDSAREILNEQEKIAGLLVVVFFAVHGAELQLAAFVSAGLLGVTYIVARSLGKIAGSQLAARLRHEGPSVRRYLGSCLLAQAGAAIALATLAADRWPGTGQQIQTVILGSVVFFEIVGPILIRWSILQAGEVPLARAIAHHTETASSQAHKMFARATEALGIQRRPATEFAHMTVAQLLRRNVAGLPQTADFEEVIAYIRQSHDNTYVVVDEQLHVVGLIRYAELSDTFFDASVDTLVRAEDLASPAIDVVHPDDPLPLAVELFRRSQDDVMAVVTREQPNRYVGIVRREELTDLAIRFRNAPKVSR